MKSRKVWKQCYERALERNKIVNERYAGLEECYSNLLKVNDKLEEQYTEAVAKGVESERRARLAVKTNTRLTQLLRSSLPIADQHGCGLDGMVQSMLALALRAKMQQLGDAERAHE